MAEMQWNLERWLESHRVTKYELAQNMSGNVKTRLTSLYRMRDPKRIDLSVMGEIVSALRHITGQEVTANDLLEYVADPEPMDDETRAWLDAGLAELAKLEPYDWGDTDPEAFGEPVTYKPGVGWVKGE